MNWTLLWRVGLTCVLLIVIPTLIATATVPGDADVAGVLLLFAPALIGAALALIPRWRWQDTLSGALAAGGLMTIEAFLRAEAAGTLANVFLPLFFASLYFIVTAALGSWLMLRAIARIRRPS